jgi:energy-coupling factor transport system ATP-binding protein
LENIAFRYDGAENDTLKTINLAIDKGECVVVTGCSGCGKTTLTRLVNGLIPHFYPGVLSGIVRINGNNIAGCAPHELSPIVGSVFQNPRTQFFTTDTNSEIVFGMENCGIPYDVMHERFAKTVETLRLQALCGRDIFTLSGGEKQHIAFGSVYALSPAIYVLDEPSANLDNAAIEQLREVLLLLKRQGKTILIAEHRLYYLRNVADRIVLMEHGRISQIFGANTLTQMPLRELHKYGLRTFSDSGVTLNKNDCATRSLELEVENLSVGYDGKSAVFCDVNLAIGKGEIVGLAGPNGLGKTTLARTVCGLMRETQGRILFDGKAVKSRKRSKHAFLVMQDPNYQLFCDSVEAELGLTISGRPPDKKDILHLARTLELEDVLPKHPLSLSGGQKQRLCIALAALSEASVLLFDEPTSGLDFRNMNRVTDMLHMLAERGKAILVISHDNEFLARACGRVIPLSRNKK